MSKCIYCFLPIAGNMGLEYTPTGKMHRDRADCIRLSVSHERKKHLTNTHILMFVMGRQGGTLHQVASDLKVEDNEILEADQEKMGELCRKAQRWYLKEVRQKFRFEVDHAMKNLKEKIKI